MKRLSWPNLTRSSVLSIETRSSVSEASDILVYVSRDWSVLAAMKEASWLARQRSRTPQERLEAAARLRDWAHQVHSEADANSSRTADLANHARLASMFRLADAWLTR